MSGMDKMNQDRAAVNGSVPEPGDSDYEEWLGAKVRAAIESADAGKFASRADVQRVMRKFVPDA